MYSEKLMKHSYKKGIEIMQLISDGMCIKETAKAAETTPRGVEYYYKEIRKVFQANDKAHLVAILFREGLIK